MLAHDLTSPTVELSFPFLFEVDGSFEPPLAGHQNTTPTPTPTPVHTDANAADADADAAALDFNELDDLLRCLTDMDASSSDGSGSEAEAEAEFGGPAAEAAASAYAAAEALLAPDATTTTTTTHSPTTADITPPPSPPSPPSTDAKPKIPKSRGSQRDSVVRRNKTRQAGKAKSTSKKFGQASTPLDGPLLRLFPKHVLRSTKEDYKDFKDQVDTKLSAAQLERLSQLRRRELSCVYADQQRKKKSQQRAEVNGNLQRLADENARVTRENERLLREVAALQQQLAAR